MFFYTLFLQPVPCSWLPALTARQLQLLLVEILIVLKWGLFQPLINHQRLNPALNWMFSPEFLIQPGNYPPRKPLPWLNY